MSRKLLIVALLASAGALGGARAETDLEFQVKAAFLYNFAKYVEWPGNSFDSQDAPVVICVLGEDPFGRILESAIQDKSVRNRRIVIRRVQRAADIPRCHLLFVSESERARMPQIFRTIDSSILTVSDSPGFARSGGIIGLFIEGGKVHFEINIAAAERAGLKLNSELLKHARIVKR